jgi:predicted metal-binding membrane protein
MALDMYGSMQGPSAWMMTARWNASYTLLMVVMWVAMMTAMMLPSAAPTLLLFGLVVRSDPGASPAVRVYLFAAGYLLVWGAYGSAMALVQRQLSLRAVMTAMMEVEANRVAGTLLILAGLYQLTPAKRACLRTCQSPAGFISRHWRTGNVGALQLGLRHGIYCLGCCWALMLVLFALGVMNLPVLLALTLFLIVEKMAPPWLHAEVTGGVLLTGFGAWLVSGWLS